MQSIKLMVSTNQIKVIEMTNLIIKTTLAIFAFIGFCYLCAFIKYQIQLQDFLLAQQF